MWRTLSPVLYETALLFLVGGCAVRTPTWWTLPPIFGIALHPSANNRFDERTWRCLATNCRSTFVNKKDGGDVRSGRSPCVRRLLTLEQPTDVRLFCTAAFCLHGDSLLLCQLSTFVGAAKTLTVSNFAADAGPVVAAALGLLTNRWLQPTRYSHRTRVPGYSTCGANAGTFD